MRRRSDLFAAMILAVVLHVGLAACATWAMRQVPLEPTFVAGESAVHLTLEAAPVMPDPRPTAPPTPVEPLPELPAESALLPLPEPEPDVPFEEAASSDPVVAPVEVPVPAALDADTRDKGVAPSVIDATAVRPRYPLGSRLRGEEGVTQLTVTVDASGRATAVTVTMSSGFSALDRAAVKAARNAHYVTRDGQTRAGETTFSIRFRLED